MKRVIAKGFRGVSLNRMAVSAMILLAAICVLSCIIGIVYTKAGARVILLSATATEVDTINQPAPYSRMDNTTHVSVWQAGPEQSGEWRTVQMRVTAYCPCKKCCGKYSDGITACGHRIRPGDAFVAADKQYSFGTEMLIPGYKNGQPVKVLDRGGAIRGNRLDVFFHSHQQALKWGVKYLDVKVRRDPRRK